MCEAGERAIRRNPDPQCGKGRQWGKRKGGWGFVSLMCLGRMAI